jgi:ribosomal protein S18 acetylase RimI-like enzyme
VIELRPFTAADVPLVEPWLDDPESRRRLGGLRLPAVVDHGLLACEHGEPVALVHVEHLETSTLALLVAPRARRRGIGHAVFALLLETELAGRPLEITAEPDNIASIRLLERAGLVAVGDDKDGFTIYRRP